jgi:RNase P subunit RPR2
MVEEEKFEVVISDKPEGAAAQESAAKPEVDLEVVDDTPEADRKYKPRPDGAEPDLPSDEEIATYSDSVQKRIKKLKYEWHEERRAKEAYQRQLDEAVRLAQTAVRAHEDLRTRYTDGAQVLAHEAKLRVESELARAKSLYKAAFEAGDSEKVAEAQEVIARLSSEKRDIESFRPQAPPQLQQPVIQPHVDDRTKDWAGKNSWFMRDKDMTDYAFLLDQRLKREGVVPSTDEYFRRLDEGVRREFPNRFDKVSSSEEVVSTQKKQGPVVAPASRSPVNSPRKVTLTKSQVALAQRLGITPEGYARQLQKLQGES